jgi:hypothetical protein
MQEMVEEHPACKTNVESIRAELIGDDTCIAAGRTVRAATPVLALCRELLASGLDPDQAVEVYRGATLALRVRSIVEAAKLQIDGRGSGFKSIKSVGIAPSVRQNAEPYAGVAI